jgi:hypothetical protein
MRLFPSTRFAVLRWLLPLLLLGAQCLALAHGVLHASGAGRAHLAQRQQLQLADAQGDASAPLFGHAHHDGAACFLYAHALAAALVLPYAMPAVVALLPTQERSLPNPQPSRALRFAASFLARAPPLRLNLNA